MSTIQQTLEFIVKGIVPTPDKVTISSKDVDGTLVFEISATPELVGQIIGKDGKIIKSIRTILTLTYPQQKFSLEIKD
jgi:uncharacterized protein